MAAEHKVRRTALIDAAVAVALCLLSSALLGALFALPARRSTGGVSRIDAFAAYAATAAHPIATSGERAR